MSREFKSPVTKNLWEYAVVTVSTLIMVFGNYFFKFPNNFAFGGITGFSTIVSALTKFSASQFTFIANMVLLVMGFIFIGKGFGMKTVYSSVLMSLALGAMDRWFPMGKPLTDQPILELVFAVFLPAVGSALLFNVGASSGGTDIIAMIFKKYTSFNIGTMLLLVDCFSVLLAFVVFDVTTGLFSTLGLIGKSLMIDGVIENINLCKCFNIVCDNPEPICDFIIKELNRSATVYQAQGAFTHHRKTVIMTTMRRSQAVKLRNFIRQAEPTAFMLISNSSEIIGKGFLSN